VGVIVQVLPTWPVMAAKSQPYTVVNKHPVLQRATLSLLKQESTSMFLYKQQYNVRNIALLLWGVKSLALKLGWPNCVTHSIYTQLSCPTFQGHARYIQWENICCRGLVSSVARVPDCCEVRVWAPDQTNTGECAAFVIISENSETFKSSSIRTINCTPRLPHLQCYRVSRGR